MNGPEFEREWSGALRRLSLLVSGKWMVTLIAMPFGPGTIEDYVVHLENIADLTRSGKHVEAYGPDLASAVNKAIDQAKELDPEFAEVEAKIAAGMGTRLNNAEALLRHYDENRSHTDPAGTVRDQGQDSEQ